MSAESRPSPDQAERSSLRRQSPPAAVLVIGIFAAACIYLTLKRPSPVPVDQDELPFALTDSPSFSPRPDLPILFIPSQSIPGPAFQQVWTSGPVTVLPSLQATGPYLRESGLSSALIIDAGSGFAFPLPGKSGDEHSIFDPEGSNVQELSERLHHYLNPGE